MHVIWRNPKDTQAEWIGLSLATACGALALVWLRWLERPTPPGLLRQWFAVPCPFCGGTRSVSALLMGEWTRAFLTNPLVAVGVVLALLWCLYAAIVLLARWPRPRILSVTPREARLLRIGVLVVLAANWAYIAGFGI